MYLQDLKSEFSALNLHSFLWPPGGDSWLKTKSDCVEVYGKVTLLFISLLPSKHFPNKFMVSVASIKSSVEHNSHEHAIFSVNSNPYS